ncbi:hypothetical protein AB6A40_000646 [Gnathostoma spinigerum]|uniref:Galactokinase n=1 Tax=Gnathostoma spinigerum TaxID=75299 RepID=A0ABD6EB77_9BILA
MSGKKPIKLMDDEETLSIKKMLLERCRTSFASHFDDVNGEFCASVAPGRVNLIGEHVDYCDGLVLPMAIPMYTMAYGRRAMDSNRGFSCVYSSNFKEKVSIHRPYDNRPPSLNSNFTSSAMAPSVIGEVQWASYVRGVLALYPHTVDVDMVIESTIPVGGGLSSSAALEMAVLFLIRQLTNLIDDDHLRLDDCAVLCRRAENLFAHVPCGIMDQMVIALARKDHALKIDCWNLTTESVPISSTAGICFLITDCGVRHELASSEYSKRRKSVDEALKKLEVKSWRDVSEGTLKARNNLFDFSQMDHALHVISETTRTTEAAIALLDNDFVKFGKLMTESHNSLRDRYRVSCAELDELVNLALSVDGVYGSRMTGGGFGGCTITLLRKSKVDEVKTTIKSKYSGKPTFYECRPVAGVERFPTNEEPILPPSE